MLFGEGGGGVLVPTAMVFCYKQIQQHNNAHHNMTWLRGGGVSSFSHPWGAISRSICTVGPCTFLARVLPGVFVDVPRSWTSHLVIYR
jgi:hypothetical protein